MSIHVSIHKGIRRQLARGGAVAVVSILGSILGACASEPASEVANLPGKEACFWTNAIFSWTALDDSTLIVDAPTDQKPYLVKLMTSIPALRASQRVGFQSGDRSGMFCRMSSVFVRQPGLGSFPDRQPVVAVRALTPKEARDMLARTRAPGTSHPAQRDDSQGVAAQPAAER